MCDVIYATPVCSKEEEHHQHLYDERSKFFQAYMQSVHEVSVEIRNIESPTDIEEIKASGVPVIAASVGLPIMLAGAKNALTCEDPEIYRCLDDKAKMTEFKFPQQFSQIPTVPLKDATEADILGLDCEEIFIKPCEGAASEDQFKVDVKTAMEYIGQHVVAQPYFAEHETIELNFLAVEGEMIDWMAITTPGGVQNEMYYKGMKKISMRGELAQSMAEFARDMCEMHQISGVMEIEFLKSGDNVYLLEVNPRISASICVMNEDGLCEYLERLVCPYLAHLGAAVKPIKWEDKHNKNLLLPPLQSVYKFWKERQNPVIKLINA